ncbi:MAG: hypothetical protein ACLP4R_25850 [Solirubrobacteraceae bacterium]
MEPLSEEQGFQLELARSTASDAIRAVALQRDRIKDRDDDAYFAAAGFRHEVDVAFLLLALRWLREACQLAVELTGDQALAGGSGKLQKTTTTPDRRVPPRSLGSRTWLGHDELAHFIWAGKEIRLDDALPAAESLFEAMRNAITPHLVVDSSGIEGIRVELVAESPSQASR